MNMGVKYYVYIELIWIEILCNTMKYYGHIQLIRAGPVAKELYVNFLPPAPAWQNLGHAHPVSAQALYMEFMEKLQQILPHFWLFCSRGCLG